MFRSRLREATKTVSDLIGDFAIASYLTDARYGVGFDALQLSHLHTLLCEIRRRSESIARSPDLVTGGGKAKAGRTTPLAPDQVDEKVACASAVAVAWKFVRGKRPGPYVRDACDAADLLFGLGMAPPGKFELVKKRPASWGTQRAAGRSPYFKKAGTPNATLSRFNGILLQKLLFFRAPPPGALWPPIGWNPLGRSQ